MGIGGYFQHFASFASPSEEDRIGAGRQVVRENTHTQTRVVFKDSLCLETLST